MRKIAIVTGASGSIGQVFVQELTKEILKMQNVSVSG